MQNSRKVILVNLELRRLGRRRNMRLPIQAVGAETEEAELSSEGCSQMPSRREVVPGGRRVWEWRGRSGSVSVSRRLSRKAGGRWMHESCPMRDRCSRGSNEEAAGCWGYQGRE